MPVRPPNPDNIRSTLLNAAHIDHEHEHDDLTGVTSDQHHAEAHTVASHSDTTATGAELETLTDGSDADALHDHASAIHDDVAGEIAAITAKTTPVDADVALIEDSAATNAKKKVSWANIKATLKTYFDTLYAVAAEGVTNGDAHDHVGGDGAQIDHGGLAGLADDDHTQYLLASGARDVTGGLTFDEIAEPANPGANHAVIWAEDEQGFGTLHWKASEDIAFELSRDRHLIARNQTGAQINAGEAVYISGSTGTVPNIAKAKADASATMPAIGIAISNIADTSFGRVKLAGDIDDLDLSSFNDGDVLYVSDATAGALTATKPAAGSLKQPVGSVTAAGTGANGVFLVDVGNALVEADIDHGSISGLADDDHTHYALTNGSRSAGVRLDCNTHQSLADATFTTVQWQVETRDDLGAVDLGTSNTDITVPTEGWYMVALAVTVFDPANVTRTICRLHKNGTAILRNDFHSPVAGHFNPVSGAVYLEANDVLTVQFWVDTSDGSNKDINDEISGQRGYFSLVRLT